MFGISSDGISGMLRFALELVEVHADEFFGFQVPLKLLLPTRLHFFSV